MLPILGLVLTPIRFVQWGSSGEPGAYILQTVVVTSLEGA